MSGTSAPRPHPPPSGRSDGPLSSDWPEENQEAAQQRDSIERMEADLRAHGIEDERIDELRDEAHERVESAIEWARDQPEPDPADAHEDMFVNPPSGVTDSEPEFDLAGGDD